MSGRVWRVDGAPSSPASSPRSPRRFRSSTPTTWGSYNGLGSAGFIHYSTNVSRAASRPHVAMPHAHRVSSAPQALAARYAPWRYPRRQLDFYLDEFTVRFNRRTSRHRGSSSTGCSSRRCRSILCPSPGSSEVALMSECAQEASSGYASGVIAIRESLPQRRGRDQPG